MEKKLIRISKIVALTGALTGIGIITIRGLNPSKEKKKQQLNFSDSIALEQFKLPPPRTDLLNSLANDYFDILIIGGGATGTGIALDGAIRGLKIGLVEKEDFGAETSSKSTKLVHGGVRYLEKAFWNLDYAQFKLVKEALKERKVFLDIAPHLSNELATMIPIYKWWKVPYYWFGSKMYDILAGSEGLQSSYWMNKKKALEAFPLLKSNNLVGAMVYYDGQHNDARMNIALALTAINYGATVLNHTEVINLIKENDMVVGAIVVDKITNKEFKVKCKGVINATGPFSDHILRMDDPDIQPIVSPSSGVHVVLPGHFCPSKIGLIDPKTSDGRVVFFLPWLGSVIAGTTDRKCEVESNPIPVKEDVKWVIKEIQNHLSPDINISEKDVGAVWSGIRPLVRDPRSKNTQELVRNHLITVSESNLITIAGGKWTTYRAMASDTIDEAIRVFKLKNEKSCTTEQVKLVGSDYYCDHFHINLIQKFDLSADVASHLAANYGDRSWLIGKMINGRKINRLVNKHPFLEEEIKYSINYEYALTIKDVLARRLRLAFLDVKSAHEIIPQVAKIMANELNWSKDKILYEIQDCENFLISMGLNFN